MTVLGNDLRINENWEQSLLSLAHEAWHAVTPARREERSRSALTDQALLKKAYDHCDSLTSYHSKSFYVASGLLKPRERQAVRALYAFCRTTDDIVDDGGAEAHSVLDIWRDRALSWHPPQHDLVALAWADARTNYHIPLRYAEQLIDGVARDLYQTRYNTFDELSTYCYSVASTVGLMSMHIIGYQSNDAIRYAVKLGVALQMTNILRDIAEDWSRGRVYLPQDELAAFGLTENDIANQVLDNRWQAFMQFQVARTRHIYEEAWPGIGMLDPQGRFAIASAASFYRAILDDIEAHDYDVFSRRAHVSKWGKIRRMPLIWLQSKRTLVA